MRRTLRVFVLLGMSLTLLALGSCGSDDPKSGGTIQILVPGFPDSLDPALGISLESYNTSTQVYPGLLVFPHESGPEGARPEPGLAEDLPEISEDGRTYKLRLRPGLRFSDGTPLKASDFKGSIERVLALDSPGAGLGFTNIAGGEEFLKTKRGGIKGIGVDDESGDITIRLVEPRGVFTHELALPFAGVVPKDTSRENQTEDPPPGAGRYAIADVRVNRSYSLVKNPRFSNALEGTAVDVGRPDAINVRVVPSPSNAISQVARNGADFTTHNPPADRTRELRETYPDRYREFPTTLTYYFFLNTEAPPFDKLQVRRAVNYAIDPEALQRIHGGLLEPLSTLLPDGIPGHEAGSDPYPFDVDKATQLVREAGAAGADVSVWGPPVPPARETVQYLVDALDRIGLDAKAKFVSGQTYLATIGDRSVHAQTGDTNWFPNYPHPADFIDNLANPDKVTDTGNINFSYNATDSELAGKINALSREPALTDSVADRWAGLDREIQDKAYMAAYGAGKRTTFFSERMDFEHCRGDEWPMAIYDWARFCLK